MNTLMKLIGSVLFLSLSVLSCDDHDEIIKEQPGEEQNYEIYSDQVSLNKRVVGCDKIMEVKTLPASTLKSSAVAADQIDLTRNYVFTLVAEVAPPQYEGAYLQATHVKIIDTYAFVTYNTQGDKYLGGLEIYNVCDIAHPQIVWQAVFPNADVSAVDYYNHKLYIVGAMNPKSIGYSLSSPAFLEVLSLKSDFSIEKVDTIIDIPSYVGTSVKANEKGIFVSGGSTGCLDVYDHEYNHIHQYSIADARCLALNSSGLYLLQGLQGTINQFSLSDYQLTNTKVTGDDLQANAKSWIEVTDQYMFAALNYGGMSMFNMDGSLKQNIPAPATPEGGNPDFYVTNSVSVNNDLVFLANGKAGIYIGGIIKERDNLIELLGSVDFGDSESSNFVESKEDVIFVAEGGGGLKILTITQDEGLPDVIIPTTPCQTLYDNVIALFKEGENNMDRFCHWFNADVTKHVLITKDTEVYVTFIDEEAWWRNSFGYYSYPLDNPPASVDDLELHYIFPNASKVGNGGALTKGDMVKLRDGKFPANTIIGFFLVVKGWKNGLTVPGMYTLYTNKEFNSESFQQHLLFIESSCKDLVLTFEEVQLNSTVYIKDWDFNDLVVTIKDNNTGLVNTSFDVTNIPLK